MIIDRSDWTVVKSSGRHTILKKGHSSTEEWLEIRKSGLGGSDAAAVLGISPWNSPYALWAEKTGQYAPNRSSSFYLNAGHILEGYVASCVQDELGIELKEDTSVFCNDAHPFMLATVDRFGVDEDILVECKTTGEYGIQHWANGVPDYYECQVRHYMAVLEIEKAYVGVLFVPNALRQAVAAGDAVESEIESCVFRNYVLERDMFYESSLISAETRFWDLVTSHTPPELDTSDATKDALMHLSTAGNQEIATRQYTDWTRRLELKNQIAKLVKEADELDRKCIMALNGKEIATYRENPIYRWQEVSSMRLDQNALKHKEPEIYNRYMTESTYRKLVDLERREKD